MSWSFCLKHQKILVYWSKWGSGSLSNCYGKIGTLLLLPCPLKTANAPTKPKCIWHRYSVSCIRGNANQATETIDEETMLARKSPFEGPNGQQLGNRSTSPLGISIMLDLSPEHLRGGITSLWSWNSIMLRGSFCSSESWWSYHASVPSAMQSNNGTHLKKINSKMWCELHRIAWMLHLKQWHSRDVEHY